MAAPAVRAPRRRRRALPVIAALLAGSSGLAGGPLAARQVAEGSSGATVSAPAGDYDHARAPRARAAPLRGSISIDGTLDESGWEGAPPITAFTQTLPLEGAPVSEETEVRILYDGDAVYVGALLHDRSPVTTRLARRDSDLGDSDVFLVLLDSFHDHETAYRFWTNPSGVKGDAIVTGNSDGAGDSSWDPVWDVASSVGDSGWSVEMRIPFSQLRFRPGGAQVWGIQLERDITRTRENATFPFTPLLERAGVSRYAHLEGISGIGAGRRLELLPYVVAQGEYLQLPPPSRAGFRNPYRSGSDHFGSAGLDLKYRIGTNVTLDAAFNPDFGQVELDPSVINLTAFETRYEERRPFFVEGADIFTFGEGGPRGSVGTGPELVYSRRIGRPPRGVLPAEAAYADTPAATTIAAAAKVTGRVGEGWSVGVLEAVTAEEVGSYTDADGGGHERTVEPAANHFVGRLRRQIRGGLTRFGMIASAVNRRTAGTPLADRLHAAAYSAGIDFAHEWGNRAWLVTSLLSGSHVGGDTRAIMRTQRASTRYYQRPDARHVELDPEARSLTGYYAMAYLGKEAGNFTMRNGVALVSPGYEVNDLGFHMNSDRVLMDTHYQYTQPNPGDVLRSWSFILGGPNAIWNFAGDRLYANINAIGRIELLNYWSTSARLLYLAPSEDDRLTRGGPMARSPGGWSGNVSVNSDRRRAAVMSARYNWGSDDAGGWTRNVQLNLSGRYEETFQFDVGPTYAWSYGAAQYVTRVADPLADRTFGARYIYAGIRRTTLSVETRMNVTFSPTLSLQLYAEPFISTGDYGTPKEFSAPNTFEFLEYGTDTGRIEHAPGGGYTVDPDGTGPAAAFRIAEEDFSYRSLLGNAVLRWEWRAGSTLFFIWQQRRINRAGEEGFLDSGSGIGRFDLGRDTSDMFDVPPDNIFMIKVNYWLNP